MGALAITQERPATAPRVGLALAVVVAHAFFLYLVFGSRPHGGVEFLQPSMTWVRIEPATESPVDASALGRPTPALAPVPPVNAAGPSLPTFTPAQDPVAAALNPYVSCALPDDNRLWTEDQKRCAQRLWELYKDAPPREPTEAEKELARKFERDLKIQNAPFLVPCFSPTGAISLICLIKGLSEGFEPNAGYAESDLRNTHVQGMPRPPKLPGMQRSVP